MSICLCVHLQNCTETRPKRSSLKDCVVEKQIRSPTLSNKTKKLKVFYTYDPAINLTYGNGWKDIANSIVGLNASDANIGIIPVC